MTTYYPIHAHRDEFGNYLHEDRIDLCPQTGTNTVINKIRFYERQINSRYNYYCHDDRI